MARSSFRSMGTAVDVLLPTSATSLVASVEALFARWDATLTRFSPDSELSRLNASAGRPVEVSDLLFEVADAALAAAAETDGIFDPTLLREIVAAGYDRTFDAMRGQDASRNASGGVSRKARPARSRPRATGWRDVRLDHRARTIRLPSGLGFDFGGIAKGMAVDAAIGMIAGAGRDIGAVDAGGDLAVLGSPSPLGWPVRVELPTGWRTISVGGALATSGISRRRWWAGDAEMHHLLDPRTGAPVATGLWSVSVAADSCRAAEIAATTAFVLGPDKGARWLADRGLDAVFVFADGRQLDAGPWSAAIAHGRPG
jgi:thiamine biosynthesis lipoprotein